MAVVDNGVSKFDCQFDISFSIDLIDVESDPHTINDLFIDFLNSIEDIGGYRFVFRKCFAKRVKGGDVDG